MPTPVCALGLPVSRWFVAIATFAACLAASTSVQAQTREFMLRGFADLGTTTFTAEDSFTAVLGGARGMVFGGGVEAVFPQRIFVSLRAARFRRTGARVFLFEGEQFDLGIPATVTVTPVEISGGYRFDRLWRIVPYGGAGAGWHRYEESSQFAEASENVQERFLGYHLMGGAEFGLARWIAAAIEAQWTTVPDALGEDPNGVASQFQESNLGGVTVRVKVVVGR